MYDYKPLITAEEAVKLGGYASADMYLIAAKTVAATAQKEDRENLAGGGY